MRSSIVCQRPSFGTVEVYPRKYWRLSSSAIPAVAGSRSRGETMISVRPPLSSVMARSASGLTRSTELRLERDDDEDGCERGGGGGGAALGGGALPGNGDGCGSVRGVEG
jgi:hypothetical protein